ncbi:G-type lectin S-receptor-like serine/threonine-protein kinase At1g34300 [Prunus persica]|uniref:G-type lectin S-receptor-like serine/threonine-protein kinase At1g34300 n=1 Tax=Prunus persica TaxID=3760 RepID=UPI0009AB51CF|nr:G-type lectin S-receptor-like serine/threonine-protein kinase At1g34300 [Prunus persica]
MTGGRGTPVYAAPEAWLGFPITHKCDVYSFGMLLFEIIGRRRNLDINIQDSQDWFPRWVWKKFEPGELRELMVVCGIEEKDKERAERMVKVALWCVQYKPEARPLMSVVVRMLEGAAEIPRPSVNPFRNLMPGTLHPNKPVGSAFHSERTSASGSISFQTVTEFSVMHATAFMTKYEIDIVCT